MIRELITAAAALLVFGASPCAPAAAAAPDQVVGVLDGQVRCLISADYQGHGDAMAICGHSDGSPFGASPMSTGKYPVKLNLAVLYGTGQMYWDDGTVPGSAGGDVTLGVGQDYRANGWTVTTSPNRAVLKNDLTGHGMIVNLADVRQF